jgi:hypothetical protein
MIADDSPLRSDHGRGRCGGRRRVERPSRERRTWKAAALDEITNIPPKTVAGMRSVIAYRVELDGREDDLPTPLRSSLLRSPLLAG